MVSDSSTGIKDIHAGSAVTLFSNAPHQITITGAEAFAGGDATLYDLNGRAMCTVKITGATQTIETEFQGIGVVKLQNDGKIQNLKVVVR